MALICSFIKILDRGSPITFVIEHLIVQREALVQARAPEVQFVCLFLLTAVQVMIPVSSSYLQLLNFPLRGCEFDFIQKSLALVKL